jgi:peptidoglycan/xylan/chitin deacetylase (PgdA/CDA1 family)
MSDAAPGDFAYPRPLHSGGGGGAFGGKRAAVSLTYDDAMHQHLDHAMLHLELAGLRGTFFINTRGGASFDSRADEWRAAAARGHELGNHTQYHPCPQRPGAPANPRCSEAYTLEQIEQELIAAEADLDAVDPASRGRRTFAYPCGVDWVGPQRTSYRDVVARMFAACRGGSRPDDLEPLRRTFFAGRAVTDAVPQEAIVHWIDEAIEQEGWLIYIFHGIGGGHLSLAAERHQGLLAALREREADVRVGTFRELAGTFRGAGLTGR